LVIDARQEKLEAEMGSSMARLRGGKGKGKRQYPVFLERGTKRMKARPWLKPSVDRERGWIQRTIRRAIEGIDP